MTSSGKSFNVEGSEGASDQPTRLLSRALVAIWVFAGIITYLEDAQPTTPFIAIWATIASSTLILLCSKFFKKKWFLRFWNSIACWKRGWRSARSKDDDDIYDHSSSSTSKPKQLIRHLKNVRNLSLPYIQETRRGKCYLVGMIVLVMMNSGVWVLFSFASKDFYNALNGGDSDAFQSAMIDYALVLFFGAPVVALYSFQREQLSNDWRKWMTERTLKLYARNRVYYHLEQNQQKGDKIDNPDQRISEDVGYFTRYMIKLLVLFLKDMINMVSFSLILYSIAPELFLVLIGYVISGILMSCFLGRSLISLNYLQLQKEANFRYSLVRLRENAENVAFYGGEELEVRSLYHRLEYIIRNRATIIWRQLGLEVFSNTYFYMAWILPIAIVAPRFFAGEIELGAVTQSREAFHNVLNDLSFIVQEFEHLSQLSAAVVRLSSFYDAIRYCDNERSQNSPLLQDLALCTSKLTIFNETSSVSTAGSEKPILRRLHPPASKIVSSIFPHNQLSENKHLLSVTNLTVLTPNYSRVLVNGLNLSLNEGQNLFIVGSSGAGKSSLLRCIAGLWNSGEGVIERPDDESVFFLPQRPYCVTGSLKDQLLYPAIDDYSSESDNSAVVDIDVLSSEQTKYKRHILTDDELLSVLDLVKLSNVAAQAGNGDRMKGLHAVQDWGNILSLGEQQRLAFGRVFVNRPRLVILDEATSALDMTMEAHMYGMLDTMAQSNGTIWSGSQEIPFKPVEGLTYISVGHRPSLLAYHDIKLRLTESGHVVDNIDREAAAKISAESSNLLV